MAEPTDLVGGRMVIGDLEVVALSDGVLTFAPTDFFPGTGEHDWALEAHRDALDETGSLVMPIGAFLVRSGDATLLVDCGLRFDDGGAFRGGRLMEALDLAGVAPGDVDVVLFTHLHADHVGWATSATPDGPGPTFPNAVYRCSQRDLDWARAGQPDLYERSVAPWESRCEPAGDLASIVPGVTARDAPGHTPGHMVVVVASGAERALLLGDAVHCPVQLTNADWAAVGDVDPALAARTRDALFQEIEGGSVAAGTSHFPGLRFGRVLGRGTGRRWTVFG